MDIPIETGKTYVTRGRAYAVVYSTNAKGTHPIHGAYWSGNEWYIMAWDFNVRVHAEYPSASDIVALA